MNVMKRAWAIAREGQKKFGGKAKEYFAVSLKLAWAETKQAKTDKVVIVINHDKMLYTVSGKGFSGRIETYKFAVGEESKVKEKRAHFYYNMGIKVFEYQVIKGGKVVTTKQDVAA